jgi:predicted SAM-dependent methyltransferase
MLSEMFRVLQPGGFCYVEVPDFPAQCRKYLKAIERRQRLQQHLIRTGIWGKSERLGMGHQFGFDEELLYRAMTKTGFDRVKMLTDKEDMVSSHYSAGAVLLARGTKVGSSKPHMVAQNLTFNELREYIIQ